MTPVLLSTDFRVPEGFSSYEISTERNPEITFEASGRSQVLVVLRGSGSLKIRTFARKGAEVRYLFWNRADGEITVDETHEVMSGADVTAAFGDCSGSRTRRTSYMALHGRHARGHLFSAALVQKQTDYRLQLVNFAPETYGLIENYAVVLKSGVLNIDAVGRIVKGARRSESHQTSRALSMEDGQRSVILPELLIDENDVQASHAMSMGRVDDEQLYYMMSRGLTPPQCTALIASGYLLPVCTMLDSEELQKELTAEMEERIAQLCSM